MAQNLIQQTQAPAKPVSATATVVKQAPKAQQKAAPKAQQKAAPKAQQKAAPKAQQKAAPKAQQKAAFNIFETLKAYGLPRPNLSHHINEGRISPNGVLTPAGITFFSGRNMGEQDRLRDAMKKAGGKGFLIECKTGKEYAFIPVKGRKLSHAPVNPGSYSADIVRAWFSLAVLNG